MSLEAPYFSSPCLILNRKSWILVGQLCARESATKTAHEMFFIQWLAKVTNDPLVQGAYPVSGIRVGSNEDCRNRESRIDEVPVKLNSAHRRHLDISDQAVRLDEMR